METTNTKTMLQIAFDYLLEVKEETFKHIWAEVFKEMKVEWKQQFPKKLIKDIEIDKKAELYTLITVVGDFIRVSPEKFGLSQTYTHQEVQAMKVNIGEISE